MTPEHADRKLAELGGKLDQLAGEHAALVGVVEHLIGLVEELQAAPPSRRYTSWFLLDDASEVAAEWEKLTGWLSRVLRFHPDVAAEPYAVRPCWPWHPWAIEELRALRWSWERAYSSKGGPAQISDWHDRQCPGTIRRLGEQLGRCDITRHQPGARDGLAPVPPRIPGVQAGERLAGWWAAAHGATSPPSPTPDELAQQGPS